MGKSRQGIKHTSPPHTQTRTHWHTHTHVNSNWSNELCICSCPHTTRMRMQSLPRRRCAACCTDPFGICTLMCPIYIGSYPYTMLSFSTMLNATSSRSSTGRCWQRRPLWRRRWSQLRLSLRLTAAAAGESASLCVCVCVCVYMCAWPWTCYAYCALSLSLPLSHPFAFETLTLFLSFSLSLSHSLSLSLSHSFTHTLPRTRSPSNPKLAWQLRSFINCDASGQKSTVRTVTAHAGRGSSANRIDANALHSPHKN